MGKAFEEKVVRQLNAERVGFTGLLKTLVVCFTDVFQSATGEAWRNRAPDSFPSFILNDAD